MSYESLLEKIESYKRDNPQLEKIMEQLNIDEASYLEALYEILGEERPVQVPPLTNSSFLNH